MTSYSDIMSPLHILTYPDYAGSVRCDHGNMEGSVVQVVKQVPQMFTCVSSPSFSQLSDSRLQLFTEQVYSIHVVF